MHEHYERLNKSWLIQLNDLNKPTIIIPRAKLFTQLSKMRTEKFHF